MITARVPYRFVCRTCRKRAYDSRKHARSAAHAAHPGDHLAAYRCPHHTGFWHVGHLKPGDRDRERRTRQSRTTRAAYLPLIAAPRQPKRLRSAQTQDRSKVVALRSLQPAQEHSRARPNLATSAVSQTTK